MFICLFLHQTTTGRWCCHPCRGVFICLFLHQTTTPAVLGWVSTRCLSVYSYIKPQLKHFKLWIIQWCLSVYSYIKPQLDCMFMSAYRGVYLSIPTSNHNRRYRLLEEGLVFICLFLHQTTTGSPTVDQTNGCLSVYSYIKPQPGTERKPITLGVYLSIPTSNHNQKIEYEGYIRVFICLFLHQTTTCSTPRIKRWLVFICLFLHQTTTVPPQHHQGRRVFICLFLHQTTT